MKNEAEELATALERLATCVRTGEPVTVAAPPSYVLGLERAARRVVDLPPGESWHALKEAIGELATALENGSGRRVKPAEILGVHVQTMILRNELERTKSLDARHVAILRQVIAKLEGASLPVPSALRAEPCSCGHRDGCECVHCSMGHRDGGRYA